MGQGNFLLSSDLRDVDAWMIYADYKAPSYEDWKENRMADLGLTETENGYVDAEGNLDPSDSWGLSEEAYYENLNRETEDALADIVHTLCGVTDFNLEETVRWEHGSDLPVFATWDVDDDLELGLYIKDYGIYHVLVLAPTERCIETVSRAYDLLHLTDVHEQHPYWSDDDEQEAWRDDHGDVTPQNIFDWYTQAMQTATNQLKAVLKVANDFEYLFRDSAWTTSQADMSNWPSLEEITRQAQAQAPSPTPAMRPRM